MSVFFRSIIRYVTNNILARIRTYSYHDFLFYNERVCTLLHCRNASQIEDEYKDNFFKNNNLQTSSDSSLDSQLSLNQDSHLKYHKTSISFEDINQQYYKKILKFSECSSFSVMEYNHKHASIFSKRFFRWFFRFFHQKFCILSPDAIFCAEIEIKKDELRKNSFIDNFPLLKAQQLNTIPMDYEYHWYIKNGDETKVLFQIFYISKKLLQTYAIQNKEKMYFCNPFEVFSSLHFFYPKLSDYTILFQDKKYHALCHYSNGLLDFSIVVERKVALQNYYNHIAISENIFYCDWTGEREFLQDFIPIESLFNTSLDICLKLVTISHFHVRPICTNFYPYDFYTLKNKVKVVLFSGFMLIGFSLCHFVYEKYQYYKFVSTQETLYYTQVQQQYNKKLNYTPMYDKIYTYLLNNKSFNFHLQQEYDETKDYPEWITKIYQH